MTISITYLTEDEFDPLSLDQTLGIQDTDPDRLAEGASDDEDDDVPVILTINADGGSDDATDDELASGLDADFLAYLNTLNGTLLNDDLLAYAAAVGAASDANFATVTADGGEAIKGVSFADSDGNAFDGDQLTYNGTAVKTIDGQNIYLWTVESSNGHILLATTSSVDAASGLLVAAFYLEPDYVGDPPSEFDVKVEMITFMELDHPDMDDPDDVISFGDLVNISVAATLSFDFDELESGNFLWVAVGDGDAGLLVTGSDLNVYDGGGKDGLLVKGGQDPCDTVNTSQGGIGATIGINAQHFVDGPKSKGQTTDGATGVFTLVDGFQPLENTGTGQATGIDIDDVDYDGYINAPSASIFISQTEGGTATFKVATWEAGGGVTPEEGKAYINTGGTGPFDQDAESALNDDTAVDIDSVVVTRGGVQYVWDDDDLSNGSTQGGITVTIDTGPGGGNFFVIEGVTTADTIEFIAESGLTFNRFTVQGLAGTNGFDIGRVDVAEGVNTTASAPLYVDDDGPAANTAGTPGMMVLDESVGTDHGGDNGAPAGTTTASLDLGVLFTGGDYGTDGAGTTGYSLVLSNDDVGSGLFVLHEAGGKGDEIKLYQVSATSVIGYVGDSPGGGGSPDFDTIFTISVNTDSLSADFGKVTFAFGADYTNIWHGDPEAMDDAETLTLAGGETLALRQTLTDADGDSIASDMQLGSNVFVVEDSGLDVVEGEIASDLFVTNASVPPLPGPVEDSFSFTGVEDADYHWVFNDAPGPVDTTPAGSDGLTWRYGDADGDSLVGKHEIIGALDGVDLYKLFIDDDGSGTATYHFSLLSGLQNTFSALDTSNIKAGGPDTNFIDVGIIDGGGGDYVRISGFFDTSGNGAGDPGEEAAVNESNLNVGVTNGNLDSGEILGFSLFEDNTDDGVVNPVLTEINGISIGTKTAQGFNFSWVGYDVHGAVVASDVGFVDKNGTILIETGALNPVAYIELKNVDGNAVKIGLGDIEILKLPSDMLLQFQASLIDADGDHEEFGFTVGIDADGVAGIDPGVLPQSLVAPAEPLASEWVHIA